MKYTELSNFTYEELSSFTYEDLSLDKYDLLTKYENSSIQLPEDVQKKLYSICEKLNESSPKSSNVFSNINLKTVGDVAKIAASLTSAIKNLNDLGLGIFLQKCFDEITSFLSQM